ncbi:MAG: MBL fold metallo-hydrolase [Gemmatimonadetes bacterium]|nr:MAG: MBL fold metallo-hydrolase [Gemmatimonadota bacterium]
MLRSRLTPARPAPTPAALFLALSLTAAPGLSGQRNFDDVEIRTVPVSEGVYMLQGAGGNIGLSVGEQGPFIVDDQFAPLSDRIRAAIAEVSDQPVHFVLNTHWHGDHTGGNEPFGEAGALIVAHDNVYKRMNPAEFADLVGRSQQAPEAALPVITFSRSMTFHWNGDDIDIIHVPHAHTDGDALVHFRRADVLHMGDTFFNHRYPFIDLDSGGDVDGVIHAAERGLALAGPGTRIIPGHGDLATPDDLRAYRDMLLTVRDRIRMMVREGKSLDEVLAARPTADFDAEWSQGNEQWRDRFVGIVYRSVGGAN